jgi:sulfofructosephosphate aldolase
MTTSTASGRGISALTRPSGGFAMLAVDQREAMRLMFQEHQDAPVPDEQVTAFKLAATRTLTPYASAVLLDRQFVLDRALDEQAVAPDCGLIVAADRFIPGPGEVVGDVAIDEDVDPAHYAARGAVAMKLLVLYRPDVAPAVRIALVEDFLDRCRTAGLVSIVEPVARAPLGGGDWDRDEGVLAAAAELGRLGADLYKAEVPLRGAGPEQEIRRRCARITELVDSPWVVLSSGVAQDAFPRAVELACREGADGFLAGRAVWQSCIGAQDPDACLRQEAVSRLQRLGEVVDAVLAER